MNTPEIIRTFTRFYQEHGHIPISGTSLIPPPRDPVLFVTSGMHPLLSYFEGTPHPQGRRLCNVQRCVRTTDLDEVGDDTHLTSFQMLGTWSLGDYDGDYSLQLGYKLLTEGFGLDPSRICVSVFGGDERCPPDQNSMLCWSDLGLPERRIHCRGREDNWWGPNSPTGGPCGPDSEIFYWVGEGEPSDNFEHPGWVEVCNHVLMRYGSDQSGRLRPLTQRNIDTGMGLERLSMILQGGANIFETDHFHGWKSHVGEMYPWLPPQTQRIFCDHLRSSLVIVEDGVKPSNSGRGYVLRRLMRRIMQHLPEDCELSQVPGELVCSTQELFGLTPGDSLFNTILIQEQSRYRSMLNRGRREVERLLVRGEDIGKEKQEYLRETFGIPPEITLRLLDEIQS